MAYKAVLFDLDGTLVDSLKDLADSMNTVLAAMGFPGHPLESYRYFVGDGVEMLVRRSLPSNKLTDVLVQDCVERMRQEYGRNWATKTRPYDGIASMLDRLRDYGATLAILSNKPHAMTVKVVGYFFPDQPFAAIRGARPGFPKKPSPEGALELARELGISPRHFLYLGDTDTDMRTAKAAGMEAIGAAWGFRTVDELIGSGAVKVICHPLELLPLLTAKS